MATIKLYANLRKIAGAKEISVTPPSGMLPSASPGTTLKVALEFLVQQHPILDGFILENGQIRPHLIITINGHNTTDPNAAVAEHDIIAVFPPIAGG